MSYSDKTKAEQVRDESLKLNKTRTGDGFDLSGNGRADVSDGQIHELARSLGWSPDRLRELLSQGGIDFHELRTMAHSSGVNSAGIDDPRELEALKLALSGEGTEGLSPDRDFSGIASFSAGPQTSGGPMGGTSIGPSPAMPVTQGNNQIDSLSVPQAEIPPLQGPNSNFQTSSSHFQTVSLEGLSVPTSNSGGFSSARAEESIFRGGNFKGQNIENASMIEAIIQAISSAIMALLGFGKGHGQRVALSTKTGVKRKRRPKRTTR